MTVRLPRVEVLLGVRDLPAHLDAEVLRRVVADRLGEDADLDFKAVPWQPGPEGNVELAKDVLAFANAGGGLLLVGVSETRGHASALVPQPADETVQRGWREVLADRAAPLLGDVEIAHVPTEPDGTGVWVVAVPRSRDGPHAVRMRGVARTEEGKAGHALLYPVRDGIATRYLTEQEVASRYRQRFAGQRADEDRLRALVEQTTAGFVPYAGRAGQWPSWHAAYLVVSLVPTLPGEEEALDGQAVARGEQRVRSWRDQGWPALRTAIGEGTNTVQRRRVVLSGVLPGGSAARPTATEHAALHVDGAAVAALFAATPVHDRSYYREVDDDDVLVGPRTVEYELLAALGLLADHAAATRAGGEALLAAQLVLPQPDRSEDQTGLRMIAIDEDQHSGVVYGTQRVTTQPPTLAVAPLADVLTGPGLVTAAARLASDLLSDFGVPQTSILHADGTVTARPGQHGQALRQWALARQVTCPL